MPQATHRLVIPDLEQAAKRAALSIPPVWPLASSVAVNPYLGQGGETLAAAGARLARVAGASVTMPRAWYRGRIACGAITDDDMREALAHAPPCERPLGLADLMSALSVEPEQPSPLPTVADLAASLSRIDWPTLIAERLGAWAASYFDEGQALWAAPRGKGLFVAWKAVASHDLTPEIAGLPGFALRVHEAPDNALAMIARASTRLALRPEALDTYFHRLLITLGGWAQVARYQLWRAELAGTSDTSAIELLAIRLLWEEALLDLYEGQVGEAWHATVADYAAPLKPSVDLVIDTVLQEAAERGAQRELATVLGQDVDWNFDQRPSMQAAFCIDVRSEVFRRALESVAPTVKTLGFAGFFGLTVAHRRFASDVEELRLPVLLNPGLRSCSGPAAMDAQDLSERVRARARRAWGRFKLAAVSSFAFVEAAGPVYVGKLVSDALGLKRPAPPADPAPRLEPPMPLADRVHTAEAVLRAMSLTSGFSRLVLLLGHGASVVNNPHASALHCGACGGYSGEVNAQLLALLLNDAEVREGLRAVGIHVPADTVFVGGLHDTTNDKVTLYPPSTRTHAHDLLLEQAQAWLTAAGALARAERALRLPRADGEAAVARRSRDWSETRPEWALAGCRAFIAAPRSRTAGRSLQGEAFLHDYEWEKDRGFDVLELILTAPVVVASWISLQYYGSTVSPETFGGGNKLLHNVTGGLGVVEGNGGLLRVGLPWQSVHDGERFVHDPLRLSVCIEAPRQAITDVLRKHESVRALFDNRWLHLFALDAQGRMAWRYAGDLTWEPFAAAEPAEETKPLKIAV